MELIVAGWTENQGGQIVDVVTKINNCRYEISLIDHGFDPFSSLVYRCFY